LFDNNRGRGEGRGIENRRGEGYFLAGGQN